MNEATVICPALLMDVEQMKPWLEKYRLGQLWTRSEIGGTRW